jgi:hypothetical protein
MDGAPRSFTYDWPGNLAVDSMIINVQHPIGASDLRVSPTAGRVVNQSDGFTYNVIDLGEVGAGESFTLNLRYQKESDSLSINGLEIEPSVPFTSGAGLPPGVLQFLPWVLGTLGLVLIAGGGFWYWRLGRGTAPTRSRRRRKAGEPDGEVAGLDAIIYCHQCGKRADTGDRFCRSCGTRLRTE